MARYIDAEALKKVMCEGCDNKHLCTESPACETVQQIDAQPTADVDYERGFIEGYTKAESDIFHGGKYAPVKHGHWVGLGDYPYEDFECDVCGYVVEGQDDMSGDKYCKNCGAKMDEVR